MVTARLVVGVALCLGSVALADIAPPPAPRRPTPRPRSVERPRPAPTRPTATPEPAEQSPAPQLLSVLGKPNIVVVTKGPVLNGEATYYAVAAAALRAEGTTVVVRERARLVSATSKGPDGDVAHVLLAQEGGLFYGPLPFQKRVGQADVSGNVRSAPPMSTIRAVAVVRVEECSAWPAWSGLCK